MKRLAAFVVLLMFTLTPLVSACMSPADSYAVEVVLNKPGIVYRPYPSFAALHNALIENGTFIFRSHYDERLYVLLWNASDGPHLKVGIPLRPVVVNVSRASLNVSILVTEEALEKLREDGWKISENTTFERNGVTITLIPVRGGECTSDADCATGGCSGEVCAPKNEASKIVTPCVYRPWYSCLGLTSCGCVNGLCTWKPNPAFESCLREHGVDPAKVIKAGYFEVRVEGVNKSDGELNAAVKDFLGAFGISCSSPLTLVKVLTTELSPAVDPSEVNASAAIKAELEWLKGVGALKINETDIEEISRVAKWGFAGHNGRIGWYETANGTYAWIPYFRSRNPSLIKCVSKDVPEYRLPNGTAYVGPTSTQPPSMSSSTSTEGFSGVSSPTAGHSGICGPGLIVLLALAGLLRKR